MNSPAVEEDAFQAVVALLRALADAEDAASRLDERVRSPLGEGLRARLEYQEACAWAWNRGDVVHVEDLVLHDEGLDARMPDQMLTRVHSVLRLWRRTGSLKPSELLSVDGLVELVGARQLDPPSGLLATPAVEPVFGSDDLVEEPGLPDPVAVGVLAPIEALISRAEAVRTEDNRAALEAWFELERETPTDWPAMLRGAVLAEAWTLIDPLPRQSHLGASLFNAGLQRAGRLQRHRVCLEVGRRACGARRQRRPDRDSGVRRVMWWLDCIKAAEVAGLEHYDRLSLARQVVAQRLNGRRSSSKLAATIDLFVRFPVVSAGLIAQELMISQQAARGLVRGLGAGVTEITGRARFKAWRL
jgi:hypothetical protein